LVTPLNKDSPEEKRTNLIMSSDDEKKSWGDLQLRRSTKEADSTHHKKGRVPTGAQCEDLWAERSLTKSYGEGSCDFTKGGKR